MILTEKGDLEPIPRHGEFRIFACMNPATDVGKKDLPAGLRARFTEVYVPPPDDDRDALLSIVKQYLGDATAGDPSLVLDVSEFYVGIKTLAQRKQIVDGTNTPPHYSMSSHLCCRRLSIFRCKAWAMGRLYDDIHHVPRRIERENGKATLRPMLAQGF